MSGTAGKSIRIKDRQFGVHIASAQIQEAVQNIAVRMNRDLAGQRPLFLAVLNGSFLFAADLMKHLEFECEISFIKLASYSGTSTTGKVKEIIGLTENIKGRTVVVLEDIVDTGITLESLYRQLNEQAPRELRTAALLFKPAAYTKAIRVDYVGIEVGNDFLVGYGLDYDGLGRNLRDIYIETKV